MSLEDTEQNVAALHAALNELRARGYELNEQRRLAVAILQHLQAERRSVAAASMQKLSALRSDIAAATLLHEHLVAKRRRMEHECALREKTLLSQSSQRKDYDKTQPSAKRIGPPLSAATKMALQELRKKSDMTEQKWAFSAAFRVMVRKQNLHKAGKVGAGLTGLGPEK